MSPLHDLEAALRARLRRQPEPAEILRALEALPAAAYVAVIESEEGQALLEEARRRRRAADRAADRDGRRARSRA